MPAHFTSAQRRNGAALRCSEKVQIMTEAELLNMFRPGKQRLVVELALRPQGVTTGEMIYYAGAPLINTLSAVHRAGHADLTRVQRDGSSAYKLILSPTMTPEQRGRQRMHAVMVEFARRVDERNYDDYEGE